MAFEIINRQPTFLTIRLKSTEVVIGPKATKGPYADQELSADIRLRESRGDLSLRYIKKEIPQEEVPQEEISKLTEEAEDLQREEGTDILSESKPRRRKRRDE